MGIIDDILGSLSLDVALSYTHLEYQKSGHDYVGKCPTGHGSVSGTSFQINTIEPTFHCWNCGIRGNYIHLVELFRHGVVSTQSGFTDTFKDTVMFLSKELGLQSESYSSGGGDAKVFDIIDHAMTIYSREMTDDYRGILLDSYGWDADFIKKERIGYGAKCPSKELREFYTVDEMLSTGLFNLSKQNDVFHIYQNRIVFPYSIGGRIRYSIGRRTATTTFIAGRPVPKYYKQYVNSEERPYVSESVRNRIVSCQKDFNECVLTEGISDFLQLKRHGINSASAVTVKFKNEDLGEMVAHCKKFKTIYICNDSEENNAGQKGAESIAETLLSAGILPRIIVLPMHGKDKMDVAEFIRDYGINEFIELKQSHSMNFLDFKIKQIDPSIDKTMIPSLLEPILKLMTELDPSQVDILINESIAKHFKVTNSRTLLSELKKTVKAGKEEKSKPPTDYGAKVSKIFDSQQAHVNVISSGQDFFNGSLYYTVTRPKLIVDDKGVPKFLNILYVVDSSGAITEVSGGQIVNNSLALTRKLSPEFKSDNWRFDTGEFSVHRYVKGKTSVDPAQLFSEITAIFNKYIYFNRPGIAEHLTAIIMASYHYMVFHTVGYGHLWAERRSGKTTAMEIMNELGFNARMSSSISDAAIFRMIEMYRPLLLIDEAENLNPSQKQRDNSNSERLELYKSGYKKNGAATRCEGQSNTVMDFSNYCIKIFSSIKSLDSTLEDRTVVHAFKRAGSEMAIPQMIPEQMRDMFSTIRDKLYVYGLTHSARLSQIYGELSNHQAMLDKHRVTHRAREIWASVLCVALLVDEYDPGAGAFKTMLDTALYSIDSREAFSWGDGKPLILLERFYLWTAKIRADLLSDSPSLDIYLRKDITNDFIKNSLRGEDEEAEWAFVNYTYIKQILRRFHVIDKDSDINRSGGAYGGAALMITPVKMLEALQTYKPDLCSEVINDIQIFIKKDPIDISELGVD